MGKKLFLADIHIGKKYLGILDTELDPLYALGQALEKSKELNAAVYIAGDLFDDLKPSSKFVNKVQDLISEHSTPVYGIPGDHDKEIDNASWMDACGIKTFSYISAHEPDVVAVPYYDDPNKVLHILEAELEKKRNTVEFVLLHGQIPEMFPFCEEKKTLPVRELNLCSYPKLRAVIAGDIHKPMECTLSDPLCNGREVQLITPGSLCSLTKAEHDKTGYLFFDGKAFKRMPYSPVRDIIECSFGVEDLDTPEKRKQISEAISHINAQSSKLKSLIVIRFIQASEELVYKLDIFDLKNILIKLVKETKGGEDAESIHLIRHDVQQDDKIREAINEVCNNPDTRSLCLDLIESIRLQQSPECILESFKRGIFDE